MDSIPKSKHNVWLTPDTIERYRQVGNFSTFKYLSNGATGFNIEFVSDNETITWLKLWNKPIYSKIKLGLNELKSIISKLNELLRG